MLIDPTASKNGGVRRTDHRLVRRAIAMDVPARRATGGTAQNGLLREEHGDDALQLMRLIKRAYDPGNIFNPGKLVSWA